MIPGAATIDPNHSLSDLHAEQLCHAGNQCTGAWRQCELSQGGVGFQVVGQLALSHLPDLPRQRREDGAMARKYGKIYATVPYSTSIFRVRKFRFLSVSHVLKAQPSSMQILL